MIKYFKLFLLKYKREILFVLISIPVLALLVFKQKKEHRKLFLNGSYTIGKVIKTKNWGNKDGLVYFYEYDIKGLKYQNKDNFSYGGRVGDKFYVIFDKDLYENHKLLFLLGKVNDSVSYPNKVWENIPLGIDKERVLKAM